VRGCALRRCRGISAPYGAGILSGCKVRSTSGICNPFSNAAGGQKNKPDGALIPRHRLGSTLYVLPSWPSQRAAQKIEVAAMSRPRAPWFGTSRMLCARKCSKPSWWISTNRRAREKASASRCNSITLDGAGREIRRPGRHPARVPAVAQLRGTTCGAPLGVRGRAGGQYLFRDRWDLKKLICERCVAPNWAAGDDPRKRALPLVARAGRWEVINRIWYEGLRERQRSYFYLKPAVRMPRCPRSPVSRARWSNIMPSK
jgi:hypothetical protein